MVLEFDSKREIICACSINKQTDLNYQWQKELDRRIKKICYDNTNDLQKQLHQVGQSFIIKADKNSQTIVAGYHWFLEWGRDAMISLPGLTLYSGHEDLCLVVLKKFTAAEHNGIIPNFLGRTKESHAYNTVDASLWFAWTVQ